MIAVDLFAGCGGLSLGLKNAGFDVRCAVEIDEVAAASFRINHPSTELLVDDICNVSRTALLRPAEGRPIDLIAGCAPCQGFCSLTKKRGDDPRNELLLEMGRLIEETSPRAVFMENVPGLLQRGKHIFNKFLQRLQANGYQVTYATVQMADYGVPQYRRRLVLVAGKGFKIQLPHVTHSRKPTSHSFIRGWVTVRDAIGGNAAPKTLSTANRIGGPRRFNWHIVRDLRPPTKARLKSAIPGAGWSHIDEDLRPKCHQGDYVGFTNSYGRMDWDEVSPTITGGCTTVAKGRFGHPDRRRYTISVREAATLQSFPRSYRFASKHIDRVCEQIGNAVPPLYATILGSALMRQLKLRDAKSRGRRTVSRRLPA